MVYLAALAIFLGVAAATWAVALALYQPFVGGDDLRRRPHFLARSAVPVGLVTLASFVPFPLGYLLSLAVWWGAARDRFGLPLPRALALFLIRAALSFLSRLTLLGALAL
jgi:hypothetical protein